MGILHVLPALVSVAAAEPEVSPALRTVVVAVESTATAPSRKTIEKQVVRGLEAPTLNVKLVSADDLAACEVADCWKGVGTKHGAAFIVRVTVRAVAVRGKGARVYDYTTKFETVDGASGELVVQGEDSACPGCQASEAAENVYLLGVDLRRKLLNIQATASQKEPAPQAPPPAVVAADVPPASPVVIAAEPPRKTEADGTSWKTYVGIGAIAAGAVGVGAGIYYFTRDGKPACSDSICPRVYESSGWAWAGLGIGGAALVGGALLFLPWSSGDGGVAIGPSSIQFQGTF